MSKFKIVLASVIGGLILTAQSRAQITNQYPATLLETMESATGQVVVKGTAPVGSMSIGSTLVSLVCKEDKLISTGDKQYGAMIAIKSSQADDKTVIDYDELDSLLGSIDYLLRVDWSVTSPASFDASYTTKAGLRLKAFSSKRTGKIEFALNGSHLTKGILLSPDQLSQFYSLLAQGKAKLDTLRTGQ